MAQSQNFEITVPAGTYWLGDPCYAVPESDWLPLLETCDYFNQPVGSLAGFSVYASGTAYGDGCYSDEHGREFGVDAGLIGLVPVAYGLRPGASQLMHKIVVTAPTTFGYSDGTIYLTGYASIQTGDEGREDDDLWADEEELAEELM